MSTLAHAGGTSIGEPEAVGLEYTVTLGYILRLSLNTMHFVGGMRALFTSGVPRCSEPCFIRRNSLEMVGGLPILIYRSLSQQLQLGVTVIRQVSFCLVYCLMVLGFLGSRSPCPSFPGLGVFSVPHCDFCRSEGGLGHDFRNLVVFSSCILLFP